MDLSAAPLEECSALTGAPTESLTPKASLELQDGPPFPAPVVASPGQVGRFQMFHLGGLKWEGKMGAVGAGLRGPKAAV